MNFTYPRNEKLKHKNDINDLTFEVVIEGTIEERKEYFINKEKYIGKPLTVEFYERTSDDEDETPSKSNFTDISFDDI